MTSVNGLTKDTVSRVYAQIANAEKRAPIEAPVFTYSFA